MAALATLPTTTFAADVGATDRTVSVVSASNIAVGVFLVSGAEAMQVTGFGPVAGLVNVIRGKLGTAARRHAATDIVWIGRGDQFYDDDPFGPPPAGPRVAPHVNVANGNVWWPLNNSTSNSGYWQITTTTYTTGPLGVQTVTLNPSVTGVYTTTS